jgi:adenine-specific DNA-methyltransferase
VATHIQRMTEVLRQSKTLQLPNNRELTLSGIRRTVDMEYVHAEAKEGENSVAIVFGPADGAISSTFVLEAAREAYARNFDRLYFLALRAFVWVNSRAEMPELPRNIGHSAV